MTRRSLLVLALLLAGACAREAEVPRVPRVLFLTQSVGYVHGVVQRPAQGGLSLAERQLVAFLGDDYELVCSQDAALVDAAYLAGFDALVFYTTGELPLSAAGRRALLAYVEQGGAFVGIHPATDTLYGFPEYGRMLGGTFDGHPWHQRVRVIVEQPDHPSARHLGAAFEITDEIYQFKDWGREGMTVVLSLDVASVDLEAQGVHRTDRDFGVAWCKPFGRGRVFYTSLGHRPEVWKDERYLRHLRGGLAWALAAR